MNQPPSELNLFQMPPDLTGQVPALVGQYLHPGLEPSPTGPTSPTIDQTCLNRPTRPTNAPYVRS